MHPFKEMNTSIANFFRPFEFFIETMLVKATESQSFLNIEVFPKLYIEDVSQTESMGKEIFNYVIP